MTRRLLAFLISMALILGAAGHIPALGSLLAAPSDGSIEIEPAQVLTNVAEDTVQPVADKPDCKNHLYGAGGGCAFDAFPESSSFDVHLISLRINPWVEACSRLDTTVPDRILRPPISVS